jgi:hypothetical protein
MIHTWNDCEELDATMAALTKIVGSVTRRLLTRLEILFSIAQSTLEYIGL